MMALCIYCEDDFAMEKDGCPHHCLECCDCCTWEAQYDAEDEADEVMNVQLEDGRQ